MTESQQRGDNPSTAEAEWLETALAGIERDQPDSQLQRLREVHARLQAQFTRIKDA